MKIDPPIMIDDLDHQEDSFNDNHPELLPGEFFLTNSPDQKLATLRPDDPFFSQYEGVRVGDRACTTKGHLLLGYRPVFARKIKDEH